MAFWMGTSTRMRAHGLQAISLGVIWPAALYAASFISPSMTQGVFVMGAAVWLFLVLLAAAGRDPKIPVLGSRLWRLAADPDP